MKHSIFLSIIACAASLSVAAQGSISDVVASVEQNNARLKAARARVSSDSIALRASNNLEDPRVAFEYNFSGSKPGNEIQSPMAIVILGGLFPSTTLNVFVVPIFYYLAALRKAKKNPNNTQI